MPGPLRLRAPCRRARCSLVEGSSASEPNVIVTLTRNGQFGAKANVNLMQKLTNKCSRILATGCLLYVAGCGAGDGTGLLGAGVVGGGSGGSSGDAQSLKAYSEKITPDQAYHLFRRAAFGATPERVEQAVRDGLAKTVDSLLRVQNETPTLSALAETYEDDMPKRWMVYLIEGRNPLRERMAMFWHDRFATSRRVLSGRDAGLALLHWQMLRDNALGDYRQFLRYLTIDPLMLIWLDGANSPKENPNENYAREFWELFTLGRDTLYTEADIREGARAFTGITLLREEDLDARPIYDILHHDETSKDVFPSRADAANYDYIAMIDLTLEQPEAAQYVARNLFAMFVHGHPSAALVEDLGERFAESGFQIEPLVRRILLSEAMFSKDAQNNRISSPVEHIVAVARTLDMHIHSEESQTSTMDRLTRNLRFAGQDLMNPPGVEGWSENEGWLQDQWVLSRISALG